MKIRNFTPAITNMSESILSIASKQPKGFRTNSFTKLIQRAEKDLLELINCTDGHVAFLSCSGSGAMDAAVSSLIENEDRVLVINGGSFGARWLEICQFYKLSVSNFQVENAKNIDLYKLESEIKKYKPHVILMQATETSCLQRYAVSEVGKLALKYKQKLIVDAITGFAIDHYDMDEFNVDATILSSQKGLGLTAGLSMVVLKDKEQIIECPKSYYFNLSLYISTHSLELNLPFTPRYSELGMPFTPNLIAIEQLSHQLKEMKKIGMKAVVKRVSDRAEHFRLLISEYKLPLKIKPECPSNCGTLYITEKASILAFTKLMEEKNLFFSPGPFDGKTIGIAHLGHLSKEDNIFFINELQGWLNNENE